MINNAEKPQLTIPRVTSSVFCSDNLELMKTIESNTIDLIYCDILYGTGKNFGDYKDLKPIRSEIKNHYIPRIKEMHRILKDTGSIFLQMDCKINHWIRCILDDVFGYDNFKNEIVWLYGAGGFNKELFCNPKHDTIFAYTKTDKYINNKLTDNVHGARLKSWWRINSIADKSGYLKIDNEVPLYRTQKPIELIKQVILMASNENDLIADFYLGSGTTAEVCKDLNRNFIGCDINPRAIEITLQRLNDARS
jgi:site-specific DNA-methyltransferase (adenine-specific)